MLDIKEDDRFERQGDDLFFDLPLSFSQAALGDEFDVPTPYGVEKVQVPPGTQPETVVRLKGRGLPVLGQNGKGDLLIRLHVWTSGASHRRTGAPLPRARQARGRAASPLARVLVQAQGSARRMTWWAIDVRPAADRREQVGAWLVTQDRTRSGGARGRDARHVCAGRGVGRGAHHRAEPSGTGAPATEPSPARVGGLGVTVAGRTRAADVRATHRYSVLAGWSQPRRIAHRGSRSGDRLRQRRARLDSRGSHSPRASPAGRRPRARSRQR